MVRFLGKADCALAASVVVVKVRWSGVSHFTLGAVSNCRRTDFGKMWRPNSLFESDPECSTLWYTLGLAIEIMMDWHTGGVDRPGPHYVRLWNAIADRSGA